MTVGKMELTRRMSDDAGITYAQADRAMNSLLDQIADTLEKGEDVIIPRFGSFRKVERAERRYVRPDTGEAAVIQAHHTARFKPGKQLKKQLNQ